MEEIKNITHQDKLNKNINDEDGIAKIEEFKNNIKERQISHQLFMAKFNNNIKDENGNAKIEEFKNNIKERQISHQLIMAKLRIQNEKVANHTPQIVEKVADPEKFEYQGKLKVTLDMIGPESNCSAKNAKVNIDPKIVKIVGKPQEKTINIEKEKFDMILVQATESFENATVLMEIIKEKDIIIQQQQKDQNKFENQVKLEVQIEQEKLLKKEKEGIKVEEAKKVEQEQADTVNFLDKKNKDFDRKLKKNRVDIKRKNQVEQNTRTLEWCNGCHLYLSKIHFCTTVGVWMNIDSFNQHLVIGRNEEDVRRTNNLEGSNYKVYNFTKRQEMHEKLQKMGDDEQHKLELKLKCQHP